MLQGCTQRGSLKSSNPRKQREWWWQGPEVRDRVLVGGTELGKPVKLYRPLHTLPIAKHGGRCSDTGRRVDRTVSVPTAMKQNQRTTAPLVLSLCSRGRGPAGCPLLIPASAPALGAGPPEQQWEGEARGEEPPFHLTGDAVAHCGGNVSGVQALSEGPGAASGKDWPRNAHPHRPRPGVLQLLVPAQPGQAVEGAALKMAHAGPSGPGPGPARRDCVGCAAAA